jgi:hypothetical protein
VRVLACWESGKGWSLAGGGIRLELRAHVVQYKTRLMIKVVQREGAREEAASNLALVEV